MKRAILILIPVGGLLAVILTLMTGTPFALRGLSSGIEEIPVPPPYHARLLKTGRFPLEGSALADIRTQVSELISASAPDLFLQNEYLPNGREKFNAHVKDWLPQMGLGVWPDRPAPGLWKNSDLLRMAVGVHVPLMYTIDRVTTGPAASRQTMELLLGSGMVVAIAHPGPTDWLLAYYKSTYLPTITQANLRIFPFFVPLLDRKSLQSAKEGDLDRWLGSARLYLRESPEDGGVLVVSK